MRSLLALTAATAAAATSWEALGPSPPDTLITLRFALRHSPASIAALESTFFAVSTPSSPTYGRHLTRDAADALVRPPAADLQAVLDFVASPRCATAITPAPGGDWVSATATCACAEALLHVPCMAHLRVSDGAVQHRLEGAAAALPPTVASAVALVAPSAPLVPRRGPLRGHSGAATTPASIRAAYQMGDYKAQGANTSTVQVAGFLEEFALLSDLQAFFKAYYPSAVGREFAVVGPNGAVSGVEAALDTQYVMAVGDGVPMTFWYTDAGNGPNPYDNEPYLTWLLNVTALPDAQLPNTISVSYSDNENTIDPAFQAAVEVLFLKLGARGTSMIHASGDGGVSGSQGGSCPGGKFVPTWPASCPYVTSVGATDTSYARAAGFSSGGFSNTRAPGAYQTSAIAAYLGSGAPGMPPQGYYNVTGRGIPDVAAVGEGFMIVSNGDTESVAGTSCSTPTFAGIVALLNDARVIKGKAPLGFLNPLLCACVCVGGGGAHVAAPARLLFAVCNSPFGTLHTPTRRCAPGSVHGHNCRVQPWVRHTRLSRNNWVGSDHWAGGTKLPRSAATCK